MSISVNDNLFNNLHNFEGFSINEKIYNYLGNLGFTGSIDDRLGKFESALGDKGLRGFIQDFGSWTPRQLFQGGQQGIFYHPRPIVSGQQILYQDSAATTPVTSDGDPVGFMRDLSGNDNHATQSTSAARPIYRTDGTLHWLEPDGVDDSMTTGNIDLSSYTKLAVFAALRKLSDSQGVSPVIMSGDAGNTINGFSMYAPHSTTSRKVAWSMGGSGQRFLAVDAFPSPETIVQSARLDNVAASLTDAIRPRVNSQLQSSFSDSVSGSAGGGGFRNDMLRLFVQQGTGDYSPNPFYGAVVSTGEPDVSVMESAESYLAGLAGITL